MMKRKLISFFAILLFCGVVAAQSQNENEEFLNAQFLILEQIHPLEQDDRERMDSLFYVEYAVSNSQEIAFNVAMSRTLDNLEYYEQYYKDIITRRAWQLYNEDIAFYRQKIGLSDVSLESIKPYLKERSEEIALTEVCVGNIKQYDIKRKEPSKPLYISLKMGKFVDNDKEKEKGFLVAYPNPFDGEINILFSLESEQNVTISVYDINGQLFDQQNLGVLNAGNHNYQLALNAPQGQYMLVVETGNKKVSNLIIKK